MSEEQIHVENETFDEDKYRYFENLYRLRQITKAFKRIDGDDIYIRYGAEKIYGRYAKVITKSLTERLPCQSMLLVLLCLQQLILARTGEKIFLIKDYQVWNNLQSTGHIPYRLFGELFSFYSERSSLGVKFICPFFNHYLDEWGLIFFRVDARNLEIEILCHDSVNEIFLIHKLMDQFKPFFEVKGFYSEQLVQEPIGFFGLIAESLGRLTGVLYERLDHFEFVASFLEILLEFRSIAELFIGNGSTIPEEIEKSDFPHEKFWEEMGGKSNVRNEGQYRKRKRKGPNLNKKRRGREKAKRNETLLLFLELPFHN